MPFIKPLPNHWRPTDFDLSGVGLSPEILHIAKTICLLESRCDDFADYLRAIFRDREQEWNAAIDQWNSGGAQISLDVGLCLELAIATNVTCPPCTARGDAILKA